MATKKNFILILFLSVLLGSCVKDPQDIPAGLTTDPVFGFAGVFGTQGISADAGINGWTVQPRVIYADSNIAYSTIFSHNECIDNCNPSLEFRLYRSWPAPNNPVEAFQQTVKPGVVELVPADEEREGFDITLSTHPGLFMSGNSYWEDVNGSSFFDTYQTTVGFSDSMRVCFLSQAFTGCTYSQCISFDPATLVPCIAYIEAEVIDFRYVKLTAKPQGTAPFTFDWSDGYQSASIVLPLQDSLSEVFASVTVTDANGNSTELNQTVKINGLFVDPCFFPIDLFSQPIVNISPSFSGGKMEIIYRDENGVEWKSTGGPQGFNTVSMINHVEYYGLSPLQQESFKTEITTSVELFDPVSGESRWLSLQSATVPFSHD